MKTQKELTQKQINNLKVEQYILNAISADGYEVGEVETDFDKINFLILTFTKEYGDLFKYYGSKQKTFENWLMGLPTCFSIDFENYKIIELCKEFGFLPVSPTEKQ